MKLFRHGNRQRSPASRRVYAAFELAYTIVDFMAALCFLVGSVLFFWPEWETPAVWLFVIGSALFMTKPALRLWREIRLARMGDLDSLSRRLQD